ncbi:polyketide synthase dehydratase-domain-containing protein [Mycena vulgaris]|nr:polyketide synthase dehydratase-domain-containing protein [Mycena vulgaris]
MLGMLLAPMERAMSLDFFEDIPPPKGLSHRRQSTADSNGPLSSSNLHINKVSHPTLAEHVINGEPILPSTAFIELLLESGANFLWDVEFVSSLLIPATSPLEISLQRLDSAWSVRTGQASLEQEHARGFMDRSPPNKFPPVRDCESIFKRLPLLDLDGFYPSLEPLAAYGPRFQRIVRCHGRSLEAIAEIKGPTQDELLDGYLLHPAIMDACIYVLHHTDISKQYSKDIIYLPSQVEHFNFYRPNQEAGTGSLALISGNGHQVIYSRYYDILITNSSGLALCEFRNLKVQMVTWAAPMTVGRRFDLIFQPLAVNANIPTIPISFPERTDKHEIKLLYETLDCMAVAIISKSLGHGVVLGEDKSRGRYLNFARQALRKVQDIHLSPDILQNLRDNWPYHFEITSRIAAVHEAVREASQKVTNALYSDDLMAKYYSKNSQTSNVCNEAARAFSGILESLRTSGKKSIKILEVGAGPGFLTSPLIDEIKQNHGLLVEYTVTDMSYALIVDLPRKITHGSIISREYDISKDPHAQGIQSETYEVVVARHLFHAGPSVKACLTSLHNLLVPGGCLLTVEQDRTAWMDNPGSVWGDFILGSFTKWFGYVDECDTWIMSPTRWKEQLEVVGFVNVQTCVESGGSGREFFFVAQKSLSGPTPSSDPPAIDLHHIYSYEFGKEIDLQWWFRDLDTAVSNQVYLLAMAGRDADAAIGIRLVIFESSMDLSNPSPLLIQHMGTFSRGENVVFFDQYRAAHVPRVAWSPPLSSTQQQLATQAVNDPSYINVRVTHWAGMSHLYDGFVDQVAKSHHSSVSAGDFVGGVVEPSSAEFIRVHINHIILMIENPHVDLAGQLLGAILSSLVTWPSSRLKTRVASAIENDNLAQIVRQHGSNIPGVQLVLADFRDCDISDRLDILISDSTTYSQHHHLRRWVPRSGKVLLWDQLLKKAIRDDPSYIRHILETVVEVIASSSLPDLVLPLRFEGTALICFSVELHGARQLILTSRRGLESLDPIKDAIEMAKVTYLKSQDDLNLRLDKCDATDVSQMNVLVRSLPTPLAGCIHMTMVLSDALFFDQTRDTFRSVYDSKLRVFEVFSEQVEIETLDFFVALSSISGLIGVPGQSNYASACTALDGVLARYANAFSLITPGILDAGYINRTSSKHIVKDGLSPISAEALWVYLADGLAKIDDSPFNQYIPDLDWDSVDQHFNLPATCRHLVSPNSRRPAVAKSQPRNGDGILTRILELLEPLTVYGLDSISAAKVAAILRPYASFSQLQLLGAITWSEIESKLQYSGQADTQGESVPLGQRTSGKAVLLDVLGVSPENFSPDIPLTFYGLDSAGASRLATALRPVMAVTAEQLMSQRTWADLLQITQLPRTMPESTAQPLVEICSGPGVPVIILPGANGAIGVFFGLQEHFHGGLWAIQMTESTSLQSLPTLLAFWKQQICEKWPHGPYRFAGYSASSLLAVALAKMMEDDGEEVVQLTFFDHFPILWARLESDLLRVKTPTPDFVDRLGYSILDMLRNDPTIGPEIVANYEAAVLGSPNAPPHSRLIVKHWRAVVPLLWDFLQQFLPKSSHNTFIGSLDAWVSSVKAPLVLIVAGYGIHVDCKLGGWPDLGASRSSKSVKVYYLNGVGHFGIFGDECVARILAL